MAMSKYREGVKAQLQEHLESTKSKLVAGCHRFLRLCKAEKISYELQIPAHLVWLSIKNRGKVGLGKVDVQELMSNVWHVGYAPEEIKTLVREAPPAPGSGSASELEKAHAKYFEECAELNRQVSEANNGHLPSFSVEFMKFLGIWGSHTNMMHHCIKAKLPGTVEEMTVDGLLNEEKVALGDPEWGEDLKAGMKFTVLPYWVFDDFPDLEDRLQEMGNVNQQIGKSESQSQLLNKIYINMSMMGSKVIFAELKSKVIASRPPFADCVPSMSGFVVKWGGNGSHIQQGISYVMTKASSKRFVEPAFWENITPDIKVSAEVWKTEGSAVNAVNFRHALWVAALTVDHKVVRDQSQLITANAAKKMFTRECMPKVFEADRLMQSVRSMLAEKSVSLKTVVLEKVSEWESLLVVISLGLSCKEVPLSNLDPHQATNVCVATLNEILKDRGVCLENKWVKHVIEQDDKKPPAAPASSSMQMRTISADNKLDMMQLCKEKGFKVAGDVMKPAVEDVPAQKGVVKSVDKEKMTIDLDEGGEVVVEAWEVHSCKWKPWDRPAAAEKIADWSSMSFEHSTEWRLATIRASVLTALAAVSDKQGKECAKLCNVFSKPRGVEASSDAASLTLIPTSPKISVRATKDLKDDMIKVEVSASKAKAIGLNTDEHITIDKHTAAPSAKSKPDTSASCFFINPFFYVQPATEPDDVNMRMQCSEWQEGFRFPIMKSTRPLKLGERLMLPKPDDEKKRKAGQPEAKDNKKAKSFSK